MNHTKKKLPTTAIAVVLLLLFLIVGVLVFVASIKVSGSATLSNGSRIGITAKGFGFGVSENKGTTRIEAGGYIVEFIDSNVIVNGIKAGKLKDEAKDYELVVDWEGLRLTSGGDTICEVD